MMPDQQKLANLYMDGELMKKTTGGLYQYVKRFFILDFETKIFSYKSSATSKKIKMGLHFSTFQTVEAKAENIYIAPKGYPCGYILITSSHRFVLFSKMPFINKWIEYINIAIQFYGNNKPDELIFEKPPQIANKPNLLPKKEKLVISTEIDPNYHLKGLLSPTNKATAGKLNDKYAMKIEVANLISPIASTMLREETYSSSTVNKMSSITNVRISKGSRVMPIMVSNPSDCKLNNHILNDLKLMTPPAKKK